MTRDATVTDDPGIVERLLAQMREHGGRATPARRLLLHALTEEPGHLTAEALAAQVRARAPGVNITTIYRNLDELERLRVIDRTRPGHGPATYHLAATAHGHLVCDQCGIVTEIPGRLFASLAEHARGQYGFTIEPHRSVIAGHCSGCRT
ncbi:MAG TPA: Fur family transcriptional regulator [Streptosporangiaceae bacterium]|nr:Fur family transcriptional regulator [Streptosporangiaceae bacterium]